MAGILRDMARFIKVNRKSTWSVSEVKTAALSNTL